MGKDEPLLSNCPLETAESSRNYARVPGYSKKRTRKEKKRKALNCSTVNPLMLHVYSYFFFIPLQINSAKCTFVFLCWAASFFLQHACTSFLSHTHSSGISTHTYTVARASVTHARTQDPMLLSKQGFFLFKKKKKQNQRRRIHTRMYVARRLLLR